MRQTGQQGQAKTDPCGTEGERENNTAKRKHQTRINGPSPRVLTSQTTARFPTLLHMPTPTKTQQTATLSPQRLGLKGGSGSMYATFTPRPSAKTTCRATQLIEIKMKWQYGLGQLSNCKCCDLIKNKYAQCVSEGSVLYACKQQTLKEACSQ